MTFNQILTEGLRTGLFVKESGSILLRAILAKIIQDGHGTLSSYNRLVLTEAGESAYPWLYEFSKVYSGILDRG